MRKPPVLALKLFGSPRISVDGATISPASPFAHAVIGYLALQRGGWVARTEVADALWPDLDHAAALAELRRQLYYLDSIARARSGRDLVLRRGRALALGPEIDVDVVMFERLAGADDRLERAAALYDGDLLEGFDGGIIARERESLRARMQDVLERIAAACERRGDLGEAIAWTRRLQLFDPYREKPVRDVMRLRFAAGDRAGALLAYREFAELLQRELQTTPLPATVALQRELASESPPGPPVRLPAETTSFVGRSGDVDRVRAALDGARLITVVGAPGVGKTRLAVRVARLVAETFSAGVTFVDLAPAVDSAGVERAVRDALGSESDRVRATPVERIIGDGALLLLLDNCEHVADAAAALAERIVERCAGARIVATSRRALDAAGERVWRLAALPVPKPGASPQDLAENPAVRLFVDRLVAARAENSEPVDLELVASICRTLDGIPLALELAASRLRSLSVAQLDRHLRGRFRLTAGGARRGKHSSLEKTYAWSYDILSPRAQRAFRRFAPFRGGFTLDAAQALCDGDVTVAIEAIDELVDHSLLDPPALADATGRYAMLQSTLEFAQLMAECAGERDNGRERHARYYVAFAAQCGRQLDGPNRQVAYPQLLADLDNVRTAFETAIVEGRALADGLAACIELLRFWTDCGFVAEARRWIDHALAQPQLQPRLRADGLRASAVLARRHGDARRAMELAGAARHAFRELGDAAGEARAIVALGNASTVVGAFERSLSLGEEGLRIATQLRSPEIEAFVTLMIAQTELSLGRLEESRAHFSRAAELCVQAELLPEFLVAMNNLAMCSLLSGSLDDAEAFAVESLRRSRESLLELHAAWALSALATVAWRRDRLGAAIALTDEVVTAARGADAAILLIRVVEDIAGYLARGENVRDAALLDGAASNARAARAMPLHPVEAERHANLLASMSARLGSTAFEAARAAGGTLSVDAALENARRIVASSPVRPIESVASLVGAGRTTTAVR